MNEVRLDLFKLHDENDRGLGRIRIEKNNKFLKEFRLLLEEIKQSTNMSNNSISKKLGCSLDLLFHYKNDRKMPLGILIKLLEIWKCCSNKTEEEYRKRSAKIQDTISELSHSSGRLLTKTKCPKFLSPDLCKIAGALAADGNLRLTANGFGYAYEVRIYDGYKDNVDNFCALVAREFGVKKMPKFDRRQNYWYARYGNKVILRYFNKILGIPTGNKSAIVRMPDVIKNSTLNNQIAFVSGFIMFDGGIHFSQPKFSVGTKSEFLYKDIKKLFAKLDLYPDYANENIACSKDVFSIEMWDREKLKIILETFIEPDTIKWKQLSYLMNGIDFIPRTLDEARNKIGIIYPRSRKSALAFSDIIDIVDTATSVTTEEVGRRLDRNPRVVFNFLKRLEEWKILTSVVKKEASPNRVYKLWEINPNLKT